MSWHFAYPTGTFFCIDNVGTRIELEIRTEAILDGGFHYYVRPCGQELPNDVEFFASVVPHGLSGLRTEGVVNRLPAAFKGLGIMRTLLPLIAERHSMPVYSSCADSKRDETRTASATAVWNHLVRDGKASYDPKEDRYRIEIRKSDAVRRDVIGA